MNESFLINGGNKLSGTVLASGSKNACFPLIATTILLNSSVTLKRVPLISDIRIAIEILESIGVNVIFDNEDKNTVVLDVPDDLGYIVPQKLGSKIRGSLYFLGALLAKNGKASIPLPGGCQIGIRGYDLHLKAMEQLGVKIWVTESTIEARCEKLQATSIKLPFPSRGVTGNIMLAATKAEGVTTILNANTSPEIINLGKVLVSMGVKIEGIGTNLIKIYGNPQKLYLNEIIIPPDKIEVGTLLVAGIISGGDVTVEDIIPEEIDVFVQYLKKMNVPVNLGKDFIQVTYSSNINGTSVITDLPPSIDPDYEPLLAALLCLLPGRHTIHDSINPNRHDNFIPELIKMGAMIEVKDNTSADIIGVNSLIPREDLYGKDIRGACALILAALSVKGKSIIHGSEQIDRGYEELDKKLKSLGAQIERVKLIHT